MNKPSIIYYVSLLVIAATSCSFYAMEQKQLMQEKLVTIEEQLILKEIKKHGIDKVQDKLNNGIALRKYYQDQNKPVFIIRQTFFDTKIKKDRLTRSIYEAMCLRYKDYESTLPKQFLSNEIRYYVIKDKPAVLVVAKLTNEEKIQEIIDKHKPTIEIHKDNWLEQISPIKIGTACVSFVCLLLLLSQVQ